jgi:membrane associated rhomboid family serine protease
VRRPPPITEFIAYPITAGIGLLAIAVTGLDKLGGRSIEALTMSAQAFWEQPWRLVTSALPHVGALHLIFNVYWLWVFGTLIEQVFGHARTLLLVAFLAAGSMAAEYALFQGGIGLSGVGYGLFGMLFILSRRDRRFADAVDSRTTQLFVVWFFLCIAATIANIFPVANVAHGMGAVLGGLAGLAIAGRPRERAASIGAAAGLIGLSLAGATALRPVVNLSSHGGVDSWRLGYTALEEKRFHEAVRHYERAVAIDADDATGWFNLGIAYSEAGDLRAAARSFERSAAIEPGNDKYRSAAQSSRCQVLLAEGPGGSLEAIKVADECMRLFGGQNLPAWGAGEDGGAGDAGPEL